MRSPSFLVNPNRIGQQLRPSLADRHNARRGVYRIDDHTRTVSGLAVTHRWDIYRGCWCRAASFICCGADDDDRLTMP